CARRAPGRSEWNWYFDVW
nr:immunoglobulin heavy chain junction region [Macaca mulatta]MOW19117.1 immunoglobulin heavy chain junction region [Macaca mulatta]MOW19212.1 immunoglobulin heavy chain junction region [Macaca mulatta]MOW19245.1 immunoglobulin heavy chain junction region [Macaca mulatta]MOW19274.1 immunoglobulin heavy chain junction region [Macaca mulatta]